jgi:hypothetical protein
MEEIKKTLASVTRTFTYLFSSIGFIGLLIGDMRKAIDAGNADFISIYYRIHFYMLYRRHYRHTFWIRIIGYM